MHNGKNAYPGAVDCITRIAEAGKKIILLSNSSKRKGGAINSLTRMGFPMEGIEVVTSGELAWQGLTERKLEPFKSLGTRCLTLGSGDEDLPYLEECGLTPADASAADFVLCRGVFSMATGDKLELFSPNILGKEEVEEQLRTARLRRIPMLVTNPDFVRPGGNEPMPGRIGQEYAEGGGTVHYVGKPHNGVYECCYSLLEGAGVSVEKAKICAVGDSLRHDVQGAINQGMKSAFIMSGIHAAELGLKECEESSPPEGDAALAALYKTHLAEGVPDRSMPTFKW
ncbi:unnamed protein product [Chrysoparadoxa australica]